MFAYLSILCYSLVLFGVLYIFDGLSSYELELNKKMEDKSTYFGYKICYLNVKLLLQRIILFSFGVYETNAIQAVMHATLEYKSSN